MDDDDDDDVESMFSFPPGSKQSHVLSARKKRKLNGQQRDEATVREKHRMLKLNKAYSQLRLVLPVENKCKLSRIETLRTAVNYIHLLSQLLDDDNGNH